MISSLSFKFGEANSKVIFNRFKKQIDKDKALAKAQKYCAYRERCISEVEQKLKDWGLDQVEIDPVVDDLVESDFINEQRFANSYARGKFNNNHWGRIKIRIHLRQKKIGEELIEAAMKKIEEKDYEKTAQTLIEKKWPELEGLEDRVRRSKLYYYMSNKGYESDVIFRLLKKVAD